MDCCCDGLFNKKSKVTECDAYETSQEKRQRWWSINVIYYTMFLMSLGFSIIITGVWPYLVKLDPTIGKEFMGYVVAANPLGQMLFSPIIGLWSNKTGSIRLPMLLTLALFTLCSALYSSLEILPGNRKIWMIITRFLVGVSSANVAAARAYLSAATKVSERTHAVSMVSLSQVLGFVVGPGLQAAVTPLGNDGLTFFGLQINMFTAAGWINVLMGLINFILFLPFSFKEHKIALKEAMYTTGKTNEKETFKALKPNRIASWTLIWAYFTMVFNFVLLETLGTSLTMDQFAWTKSEALYYMGILLSVGGIIACGTFTIIGPLSKRFSEKKLMLWGGFFLTVVSRVFCIPWGSEPPIIADVGPFNNLTLDSNGSEIVGCPSIQEWCHYTPAMSIKQFILAFCLTCIGYPLGVTLIQTIFSKVLGPRPQGVWMGLLEGAGCLSRVLGPVFVGVIYAKYGTYYTFGITSVMLILSMIWLFFISKHLRFPVEGKEEIAKDEKEKNKFLLEEEKNNGVELTVFHNSVAV